MFCKKKLDIERRRSVQEDRFTQATIKLLHIMINFAFIKVHNQQVNA